VPSLLRGFSAPVLLDDGLHDADLLVLLAHDHDAFNRWEAGQRLAWQRLLAALPHEAPRCTAGRPAFGHAMRELLRHPRWTRPSRNWC
jgi:aminopeptidase N